MSARPRHSRFPRARIDPIAEPEARSVLFAVLTHPPTDETIVLVLDDAHRGLGVVSVSGTTEADQAVGVVECLARPDLFGDHVGALVVASSRPGGGVVAGDVDRWLEMSDLAEAAGLELLEWFVIGCEVTCPRDLLGAPPRWRDARPA